MSQPESRDRDIDLVKGIACWAMVMGHTGFYLGYSAQIPPSWKTLWIMAESSVALFFMATGMNVFHHVKASESKKGWGPTRDYLIMMLALAIGGLAYNINRQTLGLMDLLQGIAAASFIAYIVLRRKWPSWALIIIALEMFGIAFGYSMTPDMSIRDGYIRVSAWEFARSLKFHAVHPDLLGKYLAMIRELVALPLWQRIFVVHFSVLPWTGCTLLGAVIMRHVRRSGNWEIFLWVFFVACIALSLYFPFFKGRNIVDFFFRGKADYVFRHVGIGGLIILAARRFYQGKNMVGRWMEFLGRESLLVFVLQWPVLEVVTNYLCPRKAGLLIDAIASIIVFTIMTFLVILLRWWRNTSGDKPAFFYCWLVTMIAASLVAVHYHYAPKWRTYVNVNFAHVISYFGALAFAMALPSMKSVMRGGRKRQPSPTVKPEEAAT